jgi:hypothetical protein
MYDLPEGAFLYPQHSLIAAFKGNLHTSILRLVKPSFIVQLLIKRRSTLPLIQLGCSLRNYTMRFRRPTPPVMINQDFFLVVVQQRQDKLAVLVSQTLTNITW